MDVNKEASKHSHKPDRGVERKWWQLSLALKQEGHDYSEIEQTWGVLTEAFHWPK